MPIISHATLAICCTACIHLAFSRLLNQVSFFALRWIDVCQNHSDGPRVERVLGCFPHVLDLWCGSDFNILGHSWYPSTFSTTPSPRRQCKCLGDCIELIAFACRQPSSMLSKGVPNQRYRLRLYAAMRVGEATNPGPDHLTVTFGVTNPTTIYRKSHLAVDLGVDTLLLSETAATVPVQSQETAAFRRQGFVSVWGQPMLPHRQSDRDAGNDSYKGVAAGVSIHSIHPIRPSRLGDTSDWYEAGRFQQAFIQFPHHEFQLINIYGYPSCGRKAKQHTNQLISHALHIAASTTFPLILCGDFNHHPDDLDSLRPLWDMGFRTAEQLYRQKYGRDMPPTFQESTRHDVAIFSPSIVPLVTKVWVDEQKLVAGHNPLCFEMQLPDSALYKQQWRMPQTWICYDPKKDVIAQHFQPPDFPADSHPLQVWTQAVEDAVHLAIQQDMQQTTDQPAPGLPKSHRGRCRPFQIKKPLCPAVSSQLGMTTIHLQLTSLACALNNSQNR